MKNLKISRKIMLLLGVLILFNSAVAVKLISAMGEVNDQSTAITTNWIPGIKTIGGINIEVNNVRRGEMRYQIEGEASEGGKKSLVAAEKAEAALVTKFAEYEKLISSDEERKIFEELKSQWAQYTASHEKYVTLSRTGALDAAKEMLMGSMKKDFDAVMAPTNALIDLNQKGADDASAQGDRIYVRQKLLGTVSIGLSLAFAVLVVVLLGRNIAKPIAELKDYMGVLQAGNYDQEVPMTDRKDEVGEMAVSIKSFRESLIQNRALEAQQKQETQRKLERQQRLDKLVQDFDRAASHAVSSVAAAATELSQTATEMAGVADRTNQQAVGVASASNQTSGTVQAVAAAVEEMSASVKEIASQVGNSAAIVKEASNEAQTATTTSNEMLEAARSIGAVATIIDGIAGQINLLALNATIESARAGEAGKGFAVVASEVKNLAGQTTKATEDIRNQLEGVQRMAENVADALIKLGSSVEKVDHVSAGIASAVEEQTAVTQEITKNMNVAASGVQQINENIGGIQTATGSTSAATQQILSASGLLSKQAEDLNAQVRTFLDAIKAA